MPAAINAAYFSPDSGVQCHCAADAQWRLSGSASELHDSIMALLDDPDALVVGLLGYPAQPLQQQLEAEVQLYRRRASASAGAGAPFHLLAPLQSEMTADQYHAALARIRTYLLAGDCYQVNFARRFSGRFQGDAFTGWQRLLQQHPAPHASFFRRANGDCVFGVSPERLLRIRDGVVVSEPIKGSRPRGASAAADAALGEALQNSAKDRAENLMIVDLLRNDLGQVCQPGSVVADPLFALHRFSNVQHLISTIRGRLRPEVTPLAALLACFPGGSVTGAPKRRAMEIIAELEPAPRGFYCGSQFVLDGAGNLDANILIRTFQTEGEQLYCHGGGGIVIDSDPEQEYAESLFKVEQLMAALADS